MREANNIREVESAIANSSLFTLHSSLFLMGFIFWPRSSRYVAERPAYLPTHCKRVGVFVDEAIDTVCRLAADYALDYLQLHGSESPDYLRALKVQCSMVRSAKGRLLPTGRKNVQCSIIKAFNISTEEDLFQTAPYAGLADLFLFDTKGKSVGGNGEKFDWSVLSAYDGDTPFLLSGGIGPDDAEALTSHFSPLTSKKCIGIDLNSRFELAPGIKDVAALRKFLNEINRK